MFYNINYRCPIILCRCLIYDQEVTPKPIGSGVDQVWRAEDYRVRKVKNLTTYHEQDTIDLGDKEFKVLFDAL